MFKQRYRLDEHTFSVSLLHALLQSFYIILKKLGEFVETNKYFFKFIVALALFRRRFVQIVRGKS
ncbi:hypothetical protein CLV24_101204 [Pontibacter ummariensis]|uniref:Uncharacterized protein n=1 Tax=Pontibacter ummariensis TaxID=1610492 RepID=A0A239B754_9BACT|nr:hypothetical protein CLV24_101204 [Pontibacter ummariensis]SNS03775.1 hypothetical protein SAMN06296052_101204 [Pontibacter ummariensis]